MSANTVYVVTKTPEICRALLLVAKDKGWTGSMYADSDYPDIYRVLCLDRTIQSISGYHEVHIGEYDALKRDHEVDVEQAISFICEEKKIVMDFLIDGHNVEVYRDKIVVSCQTITSEMLAKIDAARKTLEEE
jgi:hypothetical protein